MDFETLRLKYKPNEIKCLMIADSPPDSASHFFYFPDAYDDLRERTQEAFSKVIPEANLWDDKSFLLFFQTFGFFLDDLCHVPVNKAATEVKHRIRLESIPQLHGRLKLIDYKKLKAIIIVSQEIKPYVKEAIRRTNLPSHVRILSTVFPTTYKNKQTNQSYKEIYVEQLAKHLSELIKKNES